MHPQWEWLPLAAFSEFASMAAVARSQHRLLRAGGAPLPSGSVMAVTYAGNAASVTLPLAGPQIGAAFALRQFGRLGVDSAVIAWAGGSGVIFSLASATVLGAGALLSHRDASLGLTAAIVALVPAAVTIVALRVLDGRAVSQPGARRGGPCRPPARTHVIARPAPRPPGECAASRLQYVEVFGLAVWNWVADCLCCSRTESR